MTRILFAGTPDVAVEPLRALIEARGDIGCCCAYTSGCASGARA